jgi:tRNA pseudouridine55 synthase
LPKRKPEYFKKALVLNKREGETPLQALARLRKRSEKYREAKMTYAGRLDPMASGLLLVLTGAEVLKKNKYLALGKEYEFEVLFGLATDTQDILGKIVSSEVIVKVNPKDILKTLKYFRGKFWQRYPLYSSKTFNGKQLWQYGREGKKVDLPEREVTIKKIKFLELRKISGRRLLSDTVKRIGKVDGDFRQKEILNTWRKKLAGKKSENFYLARFTLRSSSGTYVRAIAETMGELLGVPTLAYRIKRTKIGKFDKIKL